MDPDVLVFIGKSGADLTIFENVPTHVDAFPECICLSNARDANAFLAFVVPGCIVVDCAMYTEKDLATLAEWMHGKGSLLYTFSSIKSGLENKKHLGFDGIINREDLIPALCAIGKELKSTMPS